MTAEIYRLVYVSRVSRDAGSRLASTMEDILLQSVANNRRDGLTGFLLADGANFAQVLEGPPLRVLACFRRIQEDDRHSRVSVKLEEPAGGRAFPNWSMCGLTLSDTDDALLSPPSVGAPTLAEVSAGALWQMLTSLSFRHGRQLDAEHERLVRGALGPPPAR